MSLTAMLVVNGETRGYAASELPGTVGELLASLGLDPGMVVAEVNGVIVKRVDFASHGLFSGDRVELVRFVGGG